MKNYKLIYIFNLLFLFIIFKDYEIFNIKKNNNYESDLYNKHYLSSLKKVVYTALLGKYDKIHTVNKEKGYDYFMFTDQDFNNHSNCNWTILPLAKTDNLGKKNISKLQRFYKTHPHLFFMNYDLSIYVDSSYGIKGNLDEFLLRILSPNISIYFLEHSTRNCIYKEFNAVLSSKKENLQIVNSVKERYNKQKFPDNVGLGDNSLIVRKHNDKKCINLMNHWYNEIAFYSHRDQLSFGYIFWKNGYKIVKYISKKYSSQYFQQYPHLKNNKKYYTLKEHAI